METKTQINNDNNFPQKKDEMHVNLAALVVVVICSLHIGVQVNRLNMDDMDTEPPG